MVNCKQSHVPTTDLDQRVALGYCHAISARLDSVYKALQAGGVGGLLGSGGAGFKGEVLCQACSADMSIILFQFAIYNLHRWQRF